MTAPHTALNFTVISKRNKAIYWRGLFDSGKQRIAWVIHRSARVCVGGSVLWRVAGALKRSLAGAPVFAFFEGWGFLFPSVSKRRIRRESVTE